MHNLMCKCNKGLSFCRVCKKDAPLLLCNWSSSIQLLDTSINLPLYPWPAFLIKQVHCKYFLIFFFCFLTSLVWVGKSVVLIKSDIFNKQAKNEILISLIYDHAGNKESVLLQLTLQRLLFKIELVIILRTWQGCLRRPTLSLCVCVPPCISS